MERHTVTPSLADISQDVAGEIPVDIVLHWATGEHSEEQHRTLLAPHLVRGTIVSSDSAGLSRLTRERTLCEVLKLIDGPKQVLCEHGTAIGGQPMGTWVADNSQTFYPDSIPVRDVVEQMIRAQREIDALPVHIGLGLHHGEFVSLSSGLFGPEVDLVETLAEDFTAGGEIAVTDTVSAQLPELLRVRLRPKSFPFAPTYSLRYAGLSLPDAGPRNPDAVYPAPFPRDFQLYLSTLDDPAAPGETYRSYARETTVILAKVQHERRPFLLDELANLVVTNAVMRSIAEETGVDLIKSNGSLGIYLADDPAAALEFAYELRGALASTTHPAAIALAAGEVLVFPMGHSRHEIAGGPVNIASKWAEDSGTVGRIFVDSTVQQGTIAPHVEPVTLTVSGLTLTAICI